MCQLLFFQSVSLSNQLTIAKNTAIPLEFSVQKEAKPSDNTDGGGLQQINLVSSELKSLLVVGVISESNLTCQLKEEKLQHFKKGSLLKCNPRHDCLCSWRPVI